MKELKKAKETLQQIKWQKKLSYLYYKLLAFSPLFLTTSCSILIQNICTLPKDDYQKEVMEQIQNIQRGQEHLFYQTCWYPLHQSEYHFRIFEDKNSNKTWIELGVAGEEIQVTHRFLVEELENELEQMEKKLKIEKQWLIATLMTFGIFGVLSNYSQVLESNVKQRKKTRNLEEDYPSVIVDSDSKV